jgi:lipopolysaccharide biosynthesis protein
MTVEMRRPTRNNLPLWKRALQRPGNAVIRAIEIARALIITSALRLFAQSSGREHTQAPHGIKAALVAHVYYLDLWEEVRAAWAVLPPGSRLIVTAPAPQAAELRRRAAADALIDIVECPNRGRDIGPFLSLLADGRLDGFDAVLKLHTKRSPHLVLGGLRRQELFLGLAGGRGRVARILRQFADPKVGLIGLKTMFRLRARYWMANEGLVRELCGELGVEAELAFFEGSMFWVRPAALGRLRAMGGMTQRFEQEAGQLDGTLAHALERVFALAARADGYETRSVEGQVLLSSNDLFRAPCNPAAA